jgi:hypothetical protein
MYTSFQQKGWDFAVVASQKLDFFNFWRRQVIVSWASVLSLSWAVEMVQNLSRDKLTPEKKGEALRQNWAESRQLDAASSD